MFHPSIGFGPEMLVHPFDQVSARRGWLEWIGKVLRFPRYLVAPELHDAHRVRRLAVIRENQFRNPKIAASNDSSHRESLLARLTGALGLVVAPPPLSLARFRVIQHRVFVIDKVFRFEIVGIGCRP